MSSEDGLINHGSSDADITSKEREIFLRAIFQLLDQRDSRVEANRKRYSDSQVIKSGTLKKASGHTLYLWKEKFVELRHGVFSYEEDLAWGESQRKKTIALTVDQCRCRPFLIRSNHGDCVFELTITNGPRRLWMASSMAERDAWVRSINTATLGSAGDFRVESQDSNKETNIKKRTQLLATPHLQQEGGGAAPYANEIERFNTIKAKLSKLNDPKEYRLKLAELYNKQLTVPVFFIKDNSLASSFPPSSPISLGTNSSIFSNLFSDHADVITDQRRATLSSQVWKDLYRDVINVNGDIISGDAGPEAMVGALARHVLQQADIIRSTLAERGGKFELNEGDALSCVRDVLLACNRTESGGDTYFCVNSLLSNQDLVVLTPFACEADPMQISVDIVRSTLPKRNSVLDESVVVVGGGVSSENEEGVETNDLEDSNHHHHVEGVDEALQSDDIVIDIDSLSDCDILHDDSVDCGLDDDDDDIFLSQGTPPDCQGSEIEDRESPLTGDTLRSLPSIMMRTKGCTLPTPCSGDSSSNSSKVMNLDIDEEVDSVDSCTVLQVTPKASRRHSRVKSTSFEPPTLGTSPNLTNALSKSMAVIKIHNNTSTITATTATNNNIRSAIIQKQSNLESFPEFPAAIRASLETETRSRSSSKLMALTRHSLNLKQNTPHKEYIDDPREYIPRSRSKHQSENDSSTTNDIIGNMPSKDKKSHRFSYKFLSKLTRKNSSRNSSSDSNNANNSLTNSEVNALLNLPESPQSSTHDMISNKRVTLSNSNSNNSNHHLRRRTNSSVTSQVIESFAPSMCIRVQVRAMTRYRICDADPQDEREDTWASVTGCFHQLFFIKSNCNGHPAISDRLVSVTIDDPHEIK